MRLLSMIVFKIPLKLNILLPVLDIINAGKVKVILANYHLISDLNYCSNPHCPGRNDWAFRQ